MLVALTYAGVSGSPTGGRQLADVMPRLVGDSQDVVGYGSDPQSLAGIRETIAAGGRVLLRGATGLLKFDLQTRDLERDLDGLELEVQSDALGAVQDAQFTSARLYEWVSGSNGQWVATP
jgi:hypothetical protein